MPASVAARRSVPASPPVSGDRPSRLRSRLRAAAWTALDFAWAAGCRPEGLLFRRLDLVPWRIEGLELHESRAWVEALADPARWAETPGVDHCGDYETAFRRKFRELARGAGLVFDVGAARGLYAALAAAAGARVHAFEPDPARRLALRRNLDGLAAVIRSDWIGDGSARTLRLDDYCRRRGLRPGLIKLDIEGGEAAAVRGLERVCRDARPHLLIELHTRRMRDRLGLDPAEPLRLLQTWGYRSLFNGHHGALETGDSAPDLEWCEAPPNDRLTALWASPER